jgi:hypothetical protein
MNDMERRVKGFVWFLVVLHIVGNVLTFNAPWFVLMTLPLWLLVIFMLTVK